MTRKPNRTRLNVEALESRELTTTSIGPAATLQSITLTQVITLDHSHQSVGSKLIVDTSSWKMGVRVNHNETLVRARRPRRQQGR